jgi:hypothetical protein
LRAAFSERRSARLFRGEEPGIWFDILFWDSLADAKRAAALAASLPAAAWFAHIGAVATVEHGTLAHEATSDKNLGEI